MNNQLRFTRQGDALTLVEGRSMQKIPPKKGKMVIVGWILLASMGLVALFWMDHGIGLLSAGIVEVGKWGHRFLLAQRPF